MTTISTRDTEPLAALHALRDRERELAHAKRDLIAQARGEGRSWAEIGAALGVSKQAAWELYNAEITALLDRVAQRSNLNDDEAATLAQQELAALRRERRPRNTA